jgi:hypothetical protein
MTKGIKRKLRIVSKRVSDEIARQMDRSNKFSVGMAHEGYQGGYLQAIQDVQLALEGVHPATRGWWGFGKGKSWDD